MKVAIVYDKVNRWGGAERVLLALHEIFPSAPLFTSFYLPKKAKWAEVFPKIETSFLQHIPFLRDNHELFPFLLPLAFESFDFSNYDLVISVTADAAKGIITKPETLHICYCLTPTRYLWSHREFYFKNPPAKFGLLKHFSFAFTPFEKHLRRWDEVASKRPDYFIAISKEVKKRIKRYYKRDSFLIYPPCELPFKSLEKKGRKDLQRFKDFYLVVSRLEPYKRVDLAIEAFNVLGETLVIVGEGNERRVLEKKAKKNIFFVGYIDDSSLSYLYKNCRALIFPQEEDFGITAVEALGFGKPVIAYDKGGIKEIVENGKTGVLFRSQNVSSLLQAIKDVGKIKFDKNLAFDTSKKFSKERFKKEFSELVELLIKRYFDTILFK